MAFDIKKVRADFPILQTKINGKNLIYFDNAATSQKPKAMIDELVRYYSQINANIHRGVHTLSQLATDDYESTRNLIAKIYNAKPTEVIFTKSDTESLNLLAYTLTKKFDLNGKNIVLTDTEHHSNIVPWQLQFKIQNSKFKNTQHVTRNSQTNLRYVSFDTNGLIDLDDLKTKVDSNTAIFSFTFASNTFGIINDAKKIIEIVREINPEIIVIVDAAQYVPHAKFDFKDLDSDFITFSAHKLFGPTGVGVLIGKENLLNELPPFLGGGDMIKEVNYDSSTYNDLPYKFEAGTPNIADVIAFKKSLEYLENLGWENIKSYENELTKYLLDKMAKLDFIQVYGVKQFSILNSELSIKKLPLVAFNINGVHPHDVGTILDEQGIAVRTGHHCTQLIMKKLNIPASVRASLAFYNTKEEIDLFIEGLRKVRKVFE